MQAGGRRGDYGYATPHRPCWRRVLLRKNGARAAPNLLQASPTSDGCAYAGSREWPFQLFRRRTGRDGRLITSVACGSAGGAWATNPDIGSSPGGPR